MTKITPQSQKLRALLNTNSMSFVCGVHDALSAKIAMEAGFSSLWASGLGISATAGVRDCNELSWSQVLDVVGLMNDAVDVPIIVDGDQGYGDFNNVRRFIRKLSERGLAGVSLEDKVFPKHNSFALGAQELVTIEEFCGKIKAAKDSQLHDEFCLFARTEALVAGFSVQEAVLRAKSYADAGADAVIVHSKKKDIEEIVSFLREWNDPTPVVIIPTTYYNYTPQQFEQLGVRMVVWANQLLRATITATQRTAIEIFKSSSIAHLEKDYVSVQEIFRLQNEDELHLATRKYQRGSGK